MSVYLFGNMYAIELMLSDIHVELDETCI